jgi:hypothetical protein
LWAAIGENGNVRYGVSGGEVREVMVWVWVGAKTVYEVGSGKHNEASFIYLQCGLKSLMKMFSILNVFSVWRGRPPVDRVPARCGYVSRGIFRVTMRLRGAWLGIDERQN